jgi:flagellar biosynthesis protein
MTQPKKPKRAIALRYQEGQDDAPTVVATGKGLIADKIVEKAQEAGVAIQENASLAEALAEVELGTAIPEELYPVVAEVLVWVNRMNRKRGKELFGK